MMLEATEYFLLLQKKQILQTINSKDNGKINRCKEGCKKRSFENSKREKSRETTQKSKQKRLIFSLIEKVARQKCYRYDRLKVNLMVFKKNLEK